MTPDVPAPDPDPYLYREAAERAVCWCGKASGHAGWLICVDRENRRQHPVAPGGDDT